MDSGSHQDTAYVVTGAAQGVGQAIAVRLADQGGFVVVIDVCDRLEWAHPNVQLLSGDASNPTVAAEAAALAEAHGQLTGWVNNAAVFQDAQLHTSPVAEMLRIINLNFSLAFVGTHAAVNHFISHRRPGSIVNVSSHQGQRPVRGALPYATSKAAIEGLTRAAAVDHGPHGIRVNAVALGSIDTARYQEMRSQRPVQVDREMAMIHPLGRVGSADEVAEVVNLLLSSKTSFVTGAVLPVDGGRSILGVDPEAI